MYQIALCDDELTELEKAEKMLSDYERQHSGQDFTIQRFENADELIDWIGEDSNMPDLIFMDIFMPNRQKDSFPAGMQAAKKLRSMGYKGKLVFLTSSKEYALDAFEVEAVQYMVKPVSEDKFFAVLSSLLRDIEEERRKYVVLRVEGNLVKVLVDEIVYCEAQRKTQCLHLADGVRYTLRTSMKEVYEMLSQYPEFVRIGASFVVNLGYIDSVNPREVDMNTGKKIYLPRGTYKDLKEQYFDFYCTNRG